MDPRIAGGMASLECKCVNLSTRHPYFQLFLSLKVGDRRVRIFLRITIGGSDFAVAISTQCFKAARTYIFSDLLRQGVQTIAADNV